MPQNKLLSYLKKLPKPVGIETPDVSTIKVPPLHPGVDPGLLLPTGGVALHVRPHQASQRRLGPVRDGSLGYQGGKADGAGGVGRHERQAERCVHHPLMIQGFTDAAQQAGAQVGVMMHSLQPPGPWAEQLI